MLIDGVVVRNVLKKKNKKIRRSLSRYMHYSIIQRQYSEKFNSHCT